MKWYCVSLNGGRTAVRANSEAEAMSRHAIYSGLHDILPGTTAHEISEEEAATYYYKIR